MTEQTAETPKIDPERKKVMEDPARKKAATDVAQLAVERLNNIHGTKLGTALIEQFAAYIIEQAVDVDADVLKRHATNLTTVRVVHPDDWSKRKPWLSVPTGHRLLKALMGIVREADKAAGKI